MRRASKLAAVWKSLRRNWRVASFDGARHDLYGPLVVRELEQRRVLSVTPGALVITPVVLAGLGEGEALSLDAGAAAAQQGAPEVQPLPVQQAPEDPVPTTPANEDQPAESDSAVETPIGVTPETSTDAQAAPLVDGQENPLTLTVANDQTTNEGALLSITNIGQFADYSSEIQVDEQVTPLANGPYTYTIDWGDGTAASTGTATIDSPGVPEPPTLGSFDGSHTYADNGVYTVTVSITDSLGNSASDTLNVTVNNVAPTLTPAADQTANEGSLLSITDIGTFTDPGFNNPLNVGGETSERFTYSIDWGDGTPLDSGPGTIDQPGGPGTPTAGSFNGSHTYADNGVYTVTLTLSDDDGATVSATLQVTVNNVAPTLTVPPDQTTTEGTLLSITDIGVFTDPGFDNPLNVGGETSEKFTYSIDWGDGTPVNSGPATIDVPGSIGTPTSGSFDGSHTYADNGVYNVTVSISDDDGGSTSAAFQVTVNNVAPTLIVPPNQTVNEGAALTLTDIGVFTDPGFDNPLNIGGETSEKFTYSIDWGDTTNLDSGPATIDVPGSPGTPTQGSFNGSHTYADNGVYTVTVSISDDDGGMTSDTFQVTVGNVAPTLVVAPNQTTNEGSLLSITNIGQFTDPGFDNPLNPSGETSESFTYSIDWGDGTPADTGAATIDSPGGPGTPTAGSFDGSHTYADNGVYTVTVTVFDDDGGSTSDTLQVTVNNVAPTLTVPPNQTVSEGSLLSITNIGQFTDPGFDNPLNIGGETSEKFTFAVDWGDGTPLSSGPATIDVPGSPGTLTQGSFDSSHTYADNGVYTVTVTISDDDGGSASATFQVTVNNVAPTLTVPPPQTVNEGSLLSITNIGQFTDPGFNNPLNVGGETSEQFTFSIDWGDGTPTDSGPATIDVPGSSGTPTQGSFDGNHTYADNGVYTVTVTVSDDDGGTTSATFEVTVNNVAPTLTVPPPQTIDEGSLLSITNIGQFTDPGFDNPLNPGSEKTETFTFSIDWGDGTPANTGNATIDSPGSIGVPTAGSFDGSHTYADNGVYTVTVTVFDDDGGATSATFEVTVNNVAPTLTVAPDQTVNEGSLLSITNIGQFTDPGFDNPLNVGGETSETFTYSIDWGDGTAPSTGDATIDSPGSIGVPTAGSFDGSHTYADNGVYSVTVTVFDDDGGATSATLQVTVNNVAPTLVVPVDQTVGRNAPLTLTDIGQFTDPGFDNPLNVGGETSERFTFAIDWGDGSPLDSGPGTIDTPGSPGVTTQGSFDGTHVYTTGGIYTVTVTISDDDGGMATGQFLVYVGPTLTVAGEQVVNEGSPLNITNIGQYVDPTPVGVRKDGSGADAPYEFSINWGDGTTADVGQASLAPGGTPDVAFQGAFSGGHTYADNGVYTVTVTITSPDGRVDTGTIQVTVNNVSPTLVVVGDQTVGQTRPLDITDLGLFSDPGFDNLLNVGGETTERFTFSINWGDGTPADTGPAGITAPGSVGVLTSGAFNGSHVFNAAGNYTVTVTVFDDDGGSATAQFNVTVASLIPQNLIFIPPGGGGAPPVERPPVILDSPRPVVPLQSTRDDVIRFRIAAVAGSEHRLVLRVVSPAGVEDKSNDELLPIESLDNLRLIFKRLPDGHYRIYQVQPDGIERLVVDVIVRQGRAIDVADEATDAGELPVQPQAAPPADADAAPANEENAVPQNAVPEANPPTDPNDQQARQAGMALGGGAMFYSVSGRRARQLARGARRVAEPGLSKVSRLLRRKR